MTTATIILVHGLWMNGSEMSLLKRRLQAQGFAVHQFRYRMVTQSLEHNRTQLTKFIRQHAAAGKLHLIGHSLGGVLALQTLQDHSDLPVDKIICLGSPLLDSAAGRRVSQVRAGRAILGKTLPEAVLEAPLRQWSGAQPVGVIAGNRGFGLGKLLGKLPKPNDGMVTLAETCLPGITDHLDLPCGHLRLVLSAEVAQQCVWFLRHGQFQRG